MERVKKRFNSNVFYFWVKKWFYEKRLVEVFELLFSFFVRRIFIECCVVLGFVWVYVY